MEENKNNAVEKAEKIMRNSNNSKGKSSVKKEGKNSSGNTRKNTKKINDAQRKKERKAALRQEKKENKERAKAERERIRAKKRVETAKLKAQKKAEKEKLKAAALAEKNRKKAEKLAVRQQKAADKKARKEMLKNETAKERKVRIASEKAEKKRIRDEKRDLKARQKRERLQARRAEKKKRTGQRQSNKGYGGWLAAVISLGCVTLVLASVLTFIFLTPQGNDVVMEDLYRKSFYDTVEQVDNIDCNLSKAIATSDTAALQKYLVDTAINSELAENDLQQLPLHDESKYYTTKLINQIADFSKYLNNKIAAGESLSDSDMAGLLQLYQANRTFKESLQRTVKEMGSDFSFSNMDGNGDNIVISNLNELQNLSVSYPELIYDGPFSDGQDRNEIKGLSGEEIDSMTARDRFKQIFGAYGLENVENIGETNGKIACYNVQATVDGELLYAQISKKGGKLVMFDFGGECNEINYSEEYAVSKADEFLSLNGIENMKPVWINLANNVYTINYAYEQDGVIIYSDLIKIRVCADSASVIGMEAAGYYTNHTQRIIGSPVLSSVQAAERVSGNIEINTKRLAVVPVGRTTEKLCYEFSGEYDGSTYFVYIDAVNGRQVEMFKVIDSAEGRLLI